MTKKPKTPTQEQVLVEMLKENTGVALCDSGGAYGRHWEKNAKKHLKDFMKEPKVDLTFYCYVSNRQEDKGKVCGSYCATISTFHYLLEHLGDYDPVMTKRFMDFARGPEQADETWMNSCEDWLKTIKDVNKDSDSGWCNTYNGECLLSQELLYREFCIRAASHDQPLLPGYKNLSYIMLQIHGGCDVRGGYTKPRIFKGGEIYGAAEYTITDGKNEWVFESGVQCSFLNNYDEGDDIQFDDYEYSLNPKDRGKGKIYVKGYIGYSPHNGKPLTAYP